MSARADVEQLQTTKSEKLLAYVMTVFLLIGGIWTYQRVDEWTRDRMPVRDPTAQEQRAIDRRTQARSAFFRAQREQARALHELELRREAYRTALDAGDPAARLKARYDRANAAYEQAVRDVRGARRDLAAARPAAAAADRRLSADLERRRDRQELVIFLIRLALAALFIALSYWILAHLRDRGSRYLPLAGAAVGFATIYALVVAADYLTDYFDPFDLGVLLLSLVGVAATTAAFWVLQRYISRRLPARRVRRRQCPFCAYPVRDNPRCEGCGRDVIAACATCEQPRRVGTPYCGACGAA
jgi:outer membrane murein-binding lipoprotein Lpp